MKYLAFVFIYLNILFYTGKCQIFAQQKQIEDCNYILELANKNALTLSVGDECCGYNTGRIKCKVFNGRITELYIILDRVACTNMEATFLLENDIYYLKNLKTLVSIDYLPAGISNLTNLEDLSLFTLLNKNLKVKLYNFVNKIENCEIDLDSIGCYQKNTCEYINKNLYNLYMSMNSISLCEGESPAKRIKESTALQNIAIKTENKSNQQSNNVENNENNQSNNVENNENNQSNNVENNENNQSNNYTLTIIIIAVMSLVFIIIIVILFIKNKALKKINKMNREPSIVYK
ncbi:hypothetical protein U3516DRAFT_674714 [Neocallimastix sp. 'constans']